MMKRDTYFAGRSGYRYCTPRVGHAQVLVPRICGGLERAGQGRAGLGSIGRHCPIPPAGREEDQAGQVIVTYRIPTQTMK